MPDDETRKDPDPETETEKPDPTKEVLATLARMEAKIEQVEGRVGECQKAITEGLQSAITGDSSDSTTQSDSESSTETETDLNPVTGATVEIPVPKAVEVQDPNPKRRNWLQSLW